MTRQPLPTPPPLLPPLPPLPLLTAPKMADPALQVELDDIAEHVNRLSLRDLGGNAPAESKIGRDLQTQLSLRLTHQQEHFQSPNSVCRRAVSTVERAAVNEGSNNGVVGKNLVVAYSDNHNKVAIGANDDKKGKKEKDRKIRPPPLEMPPLNHKRSTISALGSPIALSPLMNTSSTQGGIASPVMREYNPCAYPQKSEMEQPVSESIRMIEENWPPSTTYQILLSAPSTSTNPTWDREEMVRAEFRRNTTDALASPDTDIIAFWSYPSLAPIPSSAQHGQRSLETIRELFELSPRKSNLKMGNFFMNSEPMSRSIVYKAGW
ncbi:hypothetical protein BT96DRAFT_1003940 [Gymnopus androsaceus JB14]|uniref:Uncharacterized protein n=1 Tax=Gymnopus androsaceus JB14 TaxID=1447944 RepID=A0A6A4GUB7_9AGAR|nr:hypothetical protein BT96DRAFT_1003940 [Gymnopus androsaceus JB14]